MTTVESLLQWSPPNNWPTRTGPAASSSPLDGIGIRLGAGSWARWDGWKATRWAYVFPAPDAWDSPGLWGTVEHWAQGDRFTPLRVPWGNGWGGPGGFTKDQDNGILVDLAPDRVEGYELLGMRPATVFDRALINLRAWTDGAAKWGTEVARAGCYVADRINHRRPGVVPKGAQGPWWWQEGVLTPEMLRGAPGGGPLRIGMHNVSFGPTAVAARGAWVEHPDPGQPYGPDHPILYPEGPDPRMVDCGAEFDVSIDDARIGRWLDDSKIPKGELRTTMGMFAEYVARNGMRLMLTMKATPHAVAVSSINKTDAAAWAAIGVTPTNAPRLGAGLFRYATIGVAA